ncbi:MAG: slipin family protein [Planctomycetaceae bacterium]
MWKRVKIRRDELGLLFRDDVFERILLPGKYWQRLFGSDSRIEVVSLRELELQHEQIDVLVRSGHFEAVAEVVEVDATSKGVLWIDGKPERVLTKGYYLFWNRFRNVYAEVLEERDVRLVHAQLDQLVKSGLLDDYIQVVDLQDRQRGLVWVDNRFYAVLGAGLHAFWTTLSDIRIEVIDADSLRFEHRDLERILQTKSAESELEVVEVVQGSQGVVYQNGKQTEILGSGRYVFWKRVDRYQVFQVDMRELSLDIIGQDIMTEDKVTLRLNAIVTYQVVDPVRFVSVSDNSVQSLYRAAQLVLRALVGKLSLDEFLNDKENLVVQLVDRLAGRATDWGLRIHSAGIRDVILPGEMKDLLNRVTEAKKAAEANLIARREETAAMRSQVNTAKLLENNATLMRLRELETLEAISRNTHMQVLLGEQGLADKVVKML